MWQEIEILIFRTQGGCFLYHKITEMANPQVLNGLESNEEKFQSNFVNHVWGVNYTNYYRASDDFALYMAMIKIPTLYFETVAMAMYFSSSICFNLSCRYLPIEDTGIMKTI